MNRSLPYFLIVLLSCCLYAHTQAVQTVTLASPFTYNLVQDAGQPAPVAGRSFGAFEILKVSPAANGFELMLVAYDTGTFNLPVTGTKMAISVIAPSPESIKDYAPPKEPVFIRTKESFPYWIPILVTVVAVVLGLLYWLSKRKKTIPVPFAVQSPGGMSLLQEVKENWIAGKLNSLQLGEGLVNSLQAQFGMPVKKSTRQLVKEIRRNFPEVACPEVEWVLNKTDAWRFGKQPAENEEGQSAIRSLEGLFLFTTQKGSTQNG